MLLDFSKYKHPEKHSSAETEFDESIIKFIEKWHTQEYLSIYTSGSTGPPKCIYHSKKAMQESALMTGHYFNFEKANTALLCLPIDKIAGMMMVVRAITWKLKLYSLPPKRKLNLEKLPPLDFAAMLPLQALENFSALKNIKQLLLGGTALPQQLDRQLAQLPTQSFLSYGMTETISHIAIRRLNGKQASPFFTALPSISLSTDNNSCLCVTAPQLGIEHLQTNDIVQLLSPTTFDFKGRLDNIINSGGLKINAESIESQISSFIKQPFYIKGTPDAILGEQVTLFIEGKPWDEKKLKELKAQFHHITPKQFIPRKISFKENFSYTPTGKIIKNLPY